MEEHELSEEEICAALALAEGLNAKGDLDELWTLSKSGFIIRVDGKYFRCNPVRIDGRSAAHLFRMKI